MYCEQLTFDDFGVSTGLFDASWWNYNRFYWVNVERSYINDTSRLTARNLNIPVELIVRYQHNVYRSA